MEVSLRNNCFFSFASFIVFVGSGECVSFNASCCIVKCFDFCLEFDAIAVNIQQIMLATPAG